MLKFYVQVLGSYAEVCCIRTVSLMFVESYVLNLEVLGRCCLFTEKIFVLNAVDLGSE